MEESKGLTRRELLQRLGAVGGGTAVYHAMAGLGMTTSLDAQALDIRAGIGEGKHVVILGAGVAGLSTAYELLKGKSDYRCTILEANARLGGRSFTVRPGDAIVEQLEPGKVYRDTGENSSRQTCTFEPSVATGFDRPYLNAGPGRIPSAHTHVLDYCRDLGVPLEIYVMESRSNLVRGPSGPTYVNRHAGNDARGWIAERLYALVPQMTDLGAEQKKAFEGLLIAFGALGDGVTGERGKFVKDGKYQRSTRSGYQTLPGVRPGKSVDPIPLAELLASGYWTPPFYQPEDFLWQPTLFQPVGGMDRIVDALAKAVEAHRDRARIVRSAAVTRILYDERSRKWQIFHTGASQPVIADVCVSNIPMPLLQPLLPREVSFDAGFADALKAVFDAKDFLAPTTKVGWQAKRELWQSASGDRVVPIFGGISWTSHPITQIWYPSDRFHDELGVLTGAYNFSTNAKEGGEYSPKWRLDQAREGARGLAGADFASGLGRGLAIAWQNVPFLRGGWAQWQTVRNGVTHYNRLLQGDRGTGFYVCGDQLSQLPGWQEGAVASALNTTGLLAGVAFRAPQVESVPDSRIVVEGLIPLSLDE
jgi:monoamine oxidase